MNYAIALWPILYVIGVLQQPLDMRQPLTPRSECGVGTFFISKDSKDLQKFCAEEGLAQKFDPLKENEISFVSVFRVMTELSKLKTSVVFNGNEKQTYRAMLIDDQLQLFKYTAATGETSFPVVCIKTELGNKIWIASADKYVSQPVNQISLLMHVNEIKKNTSDVLLAKEYSSVLLPEIESKHFGNLPCFDGIACANDTCLKNPYQYVQCIIKPHENAVTFDGEIDAHVYRIESPFYLWIERSDIAEPIFAAYITSDDLIKM